MFPFSKKPHPYKEVRFQTTQATFVFTEIRKCFSLFHENKESEHDLKRQLSFLDWLFSV